MIDEEVKEIIDKCYTDAKKLLTEKKEYLEKMAGILLEKEVIDHKEIEDILG
jgi:cell division protease FtsH